MFIECNNCKATYKIDKNSIPSKKSYVKCTRCSSSISLTSETDSNVTMKNRVEANCNKCNTKYAIPLDKFSSDSMKVKCGKCNAHFYISKSKEDESSSKKSMELMSNLDIPEENKIEVDDLFDSVNTEEDHVTHKNETKNKVEEKYLESVDLGGVEEELEENIVGSIPKEQKYQFFLKPGELVQEEVIDTNSSLEELDLNIEKQAITEKELHTHEIESLLDEQPKDIETLEKQALKKNVSFLENHPLTNSETTYIKPKTSRLFTTSKTLKISKRILGIFILLAVIIGVVFLLSNLFHVETNESHVLNRLQERPNLEIEKGKLRWEEVFNEKLQKNIIVVYGKVKNYYFTSENINHIKVKGSLLNAKQQTIESHTSYAGKALTQKELKTLSKNDIVSFLKKTNINSKKNVLQFGDILNFQIVFFHSKKKKYKIKTSIVSYIQNNKKILVNPALKI